MKQAIAAWLLKMAISAIEKKLHGSTHPALIVLHDALHVLDNFDFNSIRKESNQ